MSREVCGCCWVPIELCEEREAMSLSDRLRPDVECAAWVIEEVKKLEADAALVKERDDCVADRTKLRTLLDCKREDIEALQARVKRLEDALLKIRDFFHCGDSCADDMAEIATNALAGDKP